MKTSARTLLQQAAGVHEQDGKGHAALYGAINPNQTLFLSLKPTCMSRTAKVARPCSEPISWRSCMT